MNTRLSQPHNDHDPTDVGNAHRLAREHGADLRYVPEIGWMAWTGVCWRQDDMAARALMMRVAETIEHERWGISSQNATRIRNALWCAESMLLTQMEEFDQEPYLLTCQNGTLDLRTGELLPHCREHMLTRCIPVAYDSQAAAPKWDQFLRQILPDPEVQAFLQRFAGYSLTGSTTEQVLLFLIGNGRNGKSVYTETLAALLGEYHTAAGISSLTTQRRTGIPNDIAALAGARLVTVSEPQQGIQLHEAMIKDLTGGDTIVARFLRKEHFTFKPQLKLVFRGNHRPRITGTDDGIWRRLLLVPFNVQIPSENVNPDLLSELREELPGILAWAVRGCLEWEERGKLSPPKVVLDTVREYREEMDPLAHFLRERCIQSPGMRTPSTLLHTAYVRWCNQTENTPVSQKSFSSALKRRGFNSRKSGGTMHWIGIGLRAREDGEDAN